MSIIEDLDQTTQELADAKAKVAALTRRQSELQAQALDKHCPFQKGDTVPFGPNRYLVVTERKLAAGEDGLWHWLVHGNGFDVRHGKSHPIGDGFKCRRTFGLSDVQYLALPADVRNSTVESMEAATREAYEARAQEPVTLGPQERQVLGFLEAHLPGFLTGQQTVRSSNILHAGHPDLTPSDVQRTLGRLVRKGVIGTRPDTADSRTIEGIEAQMEALLQNPDLRPGPRAAEAAALLAPAATPRRGARP
jgi:hypothetical protein